VNTIITEILGSHGGEYEDGCLLKIENSHLHGNESSFKGGDIS
jgi:hypothetical protein